MLALTFAAPLLLIGAAAGAIPIVLHLLASVRAPRMEFPTLRFLKLGMQRTIHRRRIQHWLLLVLRSLAVALLAVAVAEPITRAAGPWRAGDRGTVIVLDNSLSMSATDGGASRFERATAEASSLLSDEDKPSLAALLTTNGPPSVEALSADLARLRDDLSRTTVVAGRATMLERVQAGLQLLRDAPTGGKELVILSDLQRVSFDDMLTLHRLQHADDVHCVIIDTSRGPVNNVAVADLTLRGRHVAGAELELSADVRNSSPQETTVGVELLIDGQPVGQRAACRLAPAGDDGATTTVRFRYRPKAAGWWTASVALDEMDDLPADNARHAAGRLADRLNVLVVAGPDRQGAPPLLQPAVTLLAALDPFPDDSAGPLEPTVVTWTDLAANHLRGVSAAMFCEVPQFTGKQARAVIDFVRQGGTAMFFLGPGISADNYNDLLGVKAAEEGGLLPGSIGSPVGQVGPDAPERRATDFDVGHPYLADLYETQPDFPRIIVQRHYQLSTVTARTLIGLAGEQPLVTTKPFGAGQVVVCGVPAAGRWSNLATSPIFLPLVTRACLLTSAGGQEHVYLAGTRVAIRPSWSRADQQRGAVVRVFPPLAEVNPIDLPLPTTGDGVSFDRPHVAGVYRWQVVGPDIGASAPHGAFAVNAPAGEGDLTACSPGELRDALRRAGVDRLALAATLTEARAQLAASRQRRNWWDVAAAAVAALLMIELLAASLSRSPQAAVAPQGQ
jgi:hypothetical protein